MFGLGPEVIVVVVVALVLFGGSKIPKLARSLGQAKNEFEAGARESGQGEKGDGEKALDPAKDLEPAKDDEAKKG